MTDNLVLIEDLVDKVQVSCENLTKSIVELNKIIDEVSKKNNLTDDRD